LHIACNALDLLDDFAWFLHDLVCPEMVNVA